MRRDFGGFSRPGLRDKGVPRRSPLPSVNRSWLTLGIVGRTCPSLPSMHTREQVAELAEEVGYELPRDWDWLATTNQIDMLATHLIEKGREGGRAQISEFTLSPWQWYWRTSQEIPMNHEQLQAVVNHVSWARLYRGPSTEAKPYDNMKGLSSREKGDEKARRVTHA